MIPWPDDDDRDPYDAWADWYDRQRRRQIQQAAYRTLTNGVTWLLMVGGAVLILLGFVLY